MVNMVLDVFLFSHFPNLDKGGNGEDATDHPAQYALVGVDLVGNQLATKNENHISHQGADTNAEYVQVVVTVFRKQYFFCKQHGAPSKPEWDLHRVHCAHDQTEQVAV